MMLPPEQVLSGMTARQLAVVFASLAPNRRIQLVAGSQHLAWATVPVESWVVRTFRPPRQVVSANYQQITHNLSRQPVRSLPTIALVADRSEGSLMQLLKVKVQSIVPMTL